MMENINKNQPLEEKAHRLKYRADIDGLRAVAVIFVLIFHAFPNLLSGGFVGVDVFFVISGFLITSILMKEISENKFSIYHFYDRRIRRIFPALIVVLVTNLIVGWLLLFPAEYKQLGLHAVASAGFF